MLRYMYTITDWLGTICAILSPVIIVHWLMQAMGVEAFQGFLDFFQPFVKPLNAMGVSFTTPFPPVTLPMIGAVHPAMEVTVLGETLPLIQAFVALTFTMLFFVFNLASVLLKASEKKVAVTVETAKHKRRLRPDGSRAASPISTVTSGSSSSSLVSPSASSTAASVSSETRRRRPPASVQSLTTPASRARR